MAKKTFKNDVKKDSVVLYLQGGIVSVIKEADHEFEKSYAVKYQDLGCIVPENIEFYEHYNLLAFKYLQKKHGNSWKQTINPNAFGWNNALKSQEKR